MSKKNTNTKKSKTSTTTTSLIGSSSSTHNGDHSDPELNIIFKKSYQNAKRHVVEMPWHQQYASDPSVNQKYKILTTSRILKGYDQSPSDTLFRTHTYEFRIVYPPTNVHLMKNNGSGVGGVSSDNEGSEYDDEDNDDDNDDEDDDYNGCYSRRNQTNNNRLATTPRSPISAAHIRLLKRVKSSSSSSSNSRNKNQNNNNNNNNNNNSNQSGAFIEYRLRGAPVISYTQINSPQDDYIVVMTWPDGLKANFKGKFKLELSLYSFDDDNDDNDDKNSGGGDFKKLVMTNRWTSDEFSVVSKPGVWMNHQKKKMATASKNNKVMTTNNNNNNVYSGDNIANLSITPSLLDIMTGGDEDEDEMMMKHFGSDTFPTMVVKSENTMNQQQQMDHANNHGSFMQQLGALHNNNNMNNNNNTLLLSNMNMMGASTGMGSTVNSNASSVIASINERVNNQHVNRESTSGMNMNNNHISSDSGGSGGSSSSSSGNSNNNQFFDDMEPNLLPSLSLPAAMSTPLGPGPDGDYFSSLMNMSQHLLDPNTPGQVLSPNGQFIISETMNNITGDGRFLSLSFSDFSTGVTGRAMDSQEWEYASRNDDNTDRFFEKNLMNKK